MNREEKKVAKAPPLAKAPAQVKAPPQLKAPPRQKAAKAGPIGAPQTAAEEEAQLARAIWASRSEAPAQPNLDNMSYEQILALQQRAGGDVPRGNDKAKIDSMNVKLWA